MERGSSLKPCSDQFHGQHSAEGKRQNAKGKHNFVYLFIYLSKAGR